MKGVVAGVVVLVAASAGATVAWRSTEPPAPGSTTSSAATSGAQVPGPVAPSHRDPDERRSGRPDAAARVLPPAVTDQLVRIGARMDRLSRRLVVLERQADDASTFLGCVRHLPVDRVGDRQHSWGFRYDERDGSGIDTRPALVRHRGGARPDLLLLRMPARRECLSAPADPLGTGDDARAQARRAKGGATGRARPLSPRSAVRRLGRLERRMAILDRRFARFDEWESCLSWLPVTESGDAYQDLGFLFDETAGATPQRHLPAVDVDETEWDDPDYELLAFLGRDRPFARRECGHEPGEGVDRTASSRARHPARTSPAPRRAAGWLADLRGDLRSAVETWEDLVEPAQEFTQFDECMFTVGLQERGAADRGYEYVARNGSVRYRPALSYDLGELTAPQLQVMAFPGEEPPQIECNEDAGGLGTDE